jgi:hypothetical protein
MEGVPDEDFGSVGRSLLSAKLISYGESLSLKWRLKLAEEGKTVADSPCLDGTEVSCVYAGCW